MTVEKVVLGRKKVIVGIRLDLHAKELLDWALVKVADPGDLVVAIHVCRNPGGISKAKTLLNGYLEDYEGLCSKKQIALSAHVLGGYSRRRVFVREAKKHNASAVIVGICNHSFLRGRASIAKYCSKRLSSSIEVIAVYSGKVIFRRGSNFLVNGLFSDPKPSFYIKDSLPEITELDASDVSRFSCDTRDSKLSLKEDDSPIMWQLKGSLSFISLPAEEFMKQTPGWPLLQTVHSMNQLTEARKISVVRWVMSLPCRSFSDVSGSNSPTSVTDATELLTLEKIPVIPRELEDILMRNPVSCILFNYDIIKASTSDFSSGNLIGKGGCNSVYKGTLPDGKPVAVKVLASSKGAWKDFIREFDIMTTLKHDRIAPLIGICCEFNNLISIYEFMPRGSLQEILHDNRKGNSVLPWNSRFEIAIGIAEALTYIHSKCHRPVIHRDVKSSNIMLTDKLTPQLSDFGLAIWDPTSDHSLMHRDVVGTFGYLAPEYFLYGRVSDKIDVYSFGVVLLELLSGRKPIDLETEKDHESLVMWAKPRLQNRDYKSLVDPSLEGDVNEVEIHRMGLAASLCLTQAARLRPNMGEILSVLIEDKCEACNNGCLEDEGNDDEVYPESCAESHLSVALLDVNDVSASFSSLDPCTRRPRLFDQEENAIYSK